VGKRERQWRVVVLIQTRWGALVQNDCGFTQTCAGNGRRLARRPTCFCQSTKIKRWVKKREELKEEKRAPAGGPLMHGKSKGRKQGGMAKERKRDKRGGDFYQ